MITIKIAIYKKNAELHLLAGRYMDEQIFWIESDSTENISQIIADLMKGFPDSTWRQVNE